MAKKKQSLREFQAQLTDRLKAASLQDAASKLGFLAGGQHWLTDLTEINEVVSVADITPVPWAKPWFVGLASIRGMVYGCTDLAAMQGRPQESGTSENRLLLAHPRFGVNAAIRVERTLGLRNQAEMTALPQRADDAGWIKGRWQGADGQDWIELSVERLVASPQFLDAGS